MVFTPAEQQENRHHRNRASQSNGGKLADGAAAQYPVQKRKPSLQVLHRKEPVGDVVALAAWRVVAFKLWQ